MYGIMEAVPPLFPKRPTAGATPVPTFCRCWSAAWTTWCIAWALVRPCRGASAGFAHKAITVNGQRSTSLVPGEGR